MILSVVFALALQFSTGNSICSGDLDLKSCHTFEQMVLAKNVMGTFVSAPNEGVVCFDPKEDKFHIIFFSAANKRQFTMDAEGKSVSAPDIVSYDMYYQGQVDFIRGWRGKWSGHDHIAVNDSSFKSDADPEVRQSMARVNTSEIAISYAKNNATGETVIVNLLVSRSKLQFRETDVSTSGKGGGGEISGPCLATPF
jgi:hypothetical protein